MVGELGEAIANLLRKQALSRSDYYVVLQEDRRSVITKKVLLSSLLFISVRQGRFSYNGTVIHSENAAS